MPLIGSESKEYSKEGHVLMQAFVHQGTELQRTKVNEPGLKTNEVKVAIKVAGLNHRDLHIPERRGHDPEPLVLGSDGAGIIEAVGADVHSFAPGDEVIINPGLGWLHQSEAPPVSFEIVGMPYNGTFAQKYVVNEQYVEKKPSYLSWEEAGVLALSALTGYRALFTKGKVAANETLFLPGAGSGVNTYIIQFAKAIGARVIVASRSDVKRQKALELGADLAIDTNQNWERELENETIDLVIDSVGGATFNRSLAILKKGGRMVTFGATTEDEVTINIREFFYGQYQLFGSTMGSKQELQHMLQFMEQYQIRPVVDQIFEYKNIEEAFHYLKEAKQFGKVGIRF